jgi:hypothetical protein
LFTIFKKIASITPALLPLEIALMISEISKLLSLGSFAFPPVKLVPVVATFEAIPVASDAVQIF